MRLGALSSHSHLAGMSALWHDAEYIPDKKIDIPTVERGLQEEPLPSERHLLPEGIADPFAKQEAVYDVAMQQMERGIRGMEFLHGKRPAELARVAVGTLEQTAATAERPRLDPAIEVEMQTRTMLRPDLGTDPMAPTQSNRTEDRRAQDKALENRKQAASTGPEVTKTSKDAGASATDQRLLEIAEGLGVGIAAMTAAQAVDPASAAGAAAAEAMSAVKAAGVAKMAVGLSQDISDVPESVRTARRRAEHVRSRPLLDEDEDENR